MFIFGINMQTSFPSKWHNIGHLTFHPLCVCLYRVLTVFYSQSFSQPVVEPSEWNGGDRHRSNVLCAAFQPPQTLVTGVCFYRCHHCFFNNTHTQNFVSFIAYLVQHLLIELAFAKKCTEAHYLCTPAVLCLFSLHSHSLGRKRAQCLCRGNKRDINKRQRN